MGADNHMTTVPKELQDNNRGDVLELDYQSGNVRIEPHPQMDTWVRVFEDGEKIGILAGTDILGLLED